MKVKAQFWSRLEYDDEVEIPDDTDVTDHAALCEAVNTVLRERGTGGMNVLGEDIDFDDTNVYEPSGG